MCASPHPYESTHRHIHLWLLYTITLLALVMATRVLLPSQVKSRSSVTQVTGIAGAAMLFLFEGALTIGSQATTRVSLVEVCL